MRPEPAAPLTAGGFAFHAVDDAGDNGGALELGKHREHLDHHATGRGGGVERLGGRAERDAGGVEAGEYVGQSADRAGQPVDPVDEQDVEPAGAGGGECAWEGGSVGGGAGEAIDERCAGELPVVL